MMIYILIFISGLLGVLGHWLTRWAQKRTSSSFKEYLFSNKAATLQSILANITSSITICSTIPEDLAGKALMLVLAGAYMSGYSLDSTLNRDKNVSIPVPENNKKSLNDLLNDDSSL